MYFIDTNILIYAAGEPSHYKKPCELVLTAIQEKQILAVTSTEVLQEILHRYIAIRRKALGLAMVEAVLPWMEILPISKKELEEAVLLHKRYPTLSSRDAIHVATMLTHGIQDLISVDEDFDSIREIRRIDIFKLMSKPD